MDVMLIGLGYLPYITAGDKNFFFRLTPLLAKSLDALVILSVNDHKEKTFIQESDGSSIGIYNVSRPFHYGDKKRFYGEVGSLKYYHHQHKPLQQIVEIYLTVFTALPLLKRLIHDYNIQIIHFMDNLGLAMRFVKGCFPNLCVTVSAMNYNARGSLYDLYLKYSFGPLDKIVPYSKAYQERLIEIGIPKEKIQVVRWGVDLPRKQLELQQKIGLRRSMSIEPSSKLLLWSGFIQQIQEEDFYTALHVAQRVLKMDKRCYFVFAFKPESFKQSYLAGRRDRIGIISSVPDFLDLLETADFFFSPVTSRNSILAPPLTWIEAMARGTPVITNRVGGVEEIVTDETGFVAEKIEDLEEVVLRAVTFDGLFTLSENARELVRRRFNIETSAKEYLALWREGIRT